MLRWKFEFFGIGIIMRTGLDVCSHSPFPLPHECSVRTETIDRSADFRTIYSLTAEPFEKPNDLDRDSGLGLCDRDAISVG